MTFAHLNAHSDFSQLMGCATIREMSTAALAMGHKAIGFTELGTLRGHYDMSSLAGIKPIFGVQLSLVPDMSKRGCPKEERDKLLAMSPREEWHETNRRIDELYGSAGRDASPEWITLWAMDDQGLANLWKIGSAAHVDGFYYRPRIDLACIREHSAGLAVGTGGFDGAIGSALAAGREHKARSLVADLYAIFEDRMVIEIQPHRLLATSQLNAFLLKQTCPKAQIVATVSPYYVKQEDVKHHRIYASIGSHREPDDCGMPGDGHWLMSADTLRERFALYHKAIPLEVVDRAIEAAGDFADRCNAKVKIDKLNCYVPSVDLPEGVDEDTKLAGLCEKGWHGLRNIPARIADRAARLSLPEETVAAEYKARLAMELEALRSKRFASYILVVQELFDFARGAGIYVGPGRGSGAGSLVNYLVGITSVDPIQYGLMFERFISPARNDMPDIDMDFEDERRGEVVAWIRKRYGEKHVAQIATWSRLKGKAIFGEVCKKLGISDPATKAIGKQIDRLMHERKAGDARYVMTVIDAMEADFARPFAAKHPDLVEHCKALEGKMRHCGMHAAGVVACPIDLRDAVPLETAEDKASGKRVAVTAFDMNGAAAVSLLKLDVLGLKTMTVIRLACQEIAKKLGRPFGLTELENMPLEDQEVADAFTAGRMDGVFQFETPSARRACKGLRFSGFDDVSAMNAINRPGTLGSGMDAEFVKRRNAGSAKQETIYHAKVDAITADSAGVVVYQEHVIRILVEVAGYDPGAADLLRRKISKSKGKEELEKDRPIFLAGVQRVTPDMSSETAERLFDQIVDFGRYSFNKSHAVAYGVIAWWCMWLKVHHPLEFWTAILSCEKDKKKSSGHVRSAKRDGVNVLGPDVSYSKEHLSVDRAANAIRAALRDIDGIGEKAAQAIVAAQPYASIDDFAEKLLRAGGRAKINKNAGEALAKSGALDSLVPNRRQLVDRFEEAWTAWKAGTTFADDGSEDYDADAKAQIAASVSPSAADPFEKLCAEHVKVHLADMEAEDFLAEYEHAGLVWLRGILEPVKFGSVGQYEENEPDEDEKRRMGFGRRNAVGFIEDASGAKVRVRIDPDEVDAYAEILDAQKSVDCLLAGAVGRKYMGHQAFKLRMIVPLRQLQDDLSAGTALSLPQALAIGKPPVIDAGLNEDQLKCAQWDLNKLILKVAKRQAELDEAVSTTIVGTVAWVRLKITKRDDEMAWIGIVGATGAIEATAFPSTWKRVCEKIHVGAHVEAELTYKGDGFLLDKVKPIVRRTNRRRSA
jgi:DNA polymerase-3 subunit alpha